MQSLKCNFMSSEDKTAVCFLAGAAHTAVKVRVCECFENHVFFQTAVCLESSNSPVTTYF